MKRMKKITACVLLAVLLVTTLVVSTAAAEGIVTAAELFGFGPQSLLGRATEQIQLNKEQQEAEETDASMKVAAVDANGNLIAMTNVAPDATITSSPSKSNLSRLNDLNTGNYWSYSDSQYANVTVTLTWPTAQTLNEIVISLYNSTRGRINSVRYSTSASGGTFTDFGTLTTSSGTVTAASSTAISGIRRVQIVFYRTSNNRAFGAYEIYANAETTIDLAYFPVTLYNYSTTLAPISGKTDMNVVMRALETAANGGTAPSVWNGFYFNNGAPGSTYAAHNVWTGSSSVYTGIVSNTLKADGTPNFTTGDAGVFDTTTDSKNIYTNVGLPFIYDAANRKYTYDSNVISAYFPNKSYQSNTNLTVDPTFKVGGYGDFFPFNVPGDTTPVYHFGLRAELPFTMTSNGRMIDNDDTSPEIIFSFSGDDDVWVFLDNQLALDIGGIHGAANGELNFAANTVTVNGTVVGKIFNEEDENGNLVSTGVLGVTRAYFSQTEHTLKIFYLERGSNVSNCKIEFNLPLNDQLDITKNVDTSALINPTAEELASINAADYEFTLISVNPETSAETVSGNTTYFLYNGSTFIGARKTDANGKFTLKNGQTARIPGQLTSYYKVVETEPQGNFSAVTWDVSWNGTSIASNTSYTSPTSNTVSAPLTVDRLRFVCTNKINEYYCVISPESFVLDYGLPVILDVLANDSQYGVPLVLTGATGATNGTIEIVRKLEDGSYEIVSAADLADNSNNEYRYIRYTPNKFMSSIDTITYTIRTNEYTGSEYITGSRQTTATVIPATSVYYEENIGIEYVDGLINDESSEQNSWSDITVNPGALYQEMGLVTEGALRPYSTYGTDLTYTASLLKDSAGTSKTVNSAASNSGIAAPYFTFTFTGTGAVVYMRTDTRSGMVKVTISDKNGAEVATALTRSLYYAIDTVTDPQTGTTLYNIPIYNINGLAYDTYTVKVVCLNYIPVGIGGSQLFINNSGETLNTFYVDGVEILDPLGVGTLPEAADKAYTTDGEDNTTIVELRDKLLADSTRIDELNGELLWDNDSYVLFTDTDGTVILASDYETKGPKNEVYLSDGQSIEFKLSNWYRDYENTINLYLGAKTPDGTAGRIILAYTVDGIDRTETINVTSTADCYYKITELVSRNGYEGTIKITASTNAVISLTNIKVTGKLYDVIENG